MSSLENWIIKSLLQQIEAAGNTGEATLLSKICAKDPIAFGEKGTETWRKIQVLWSNLKQRSVPQYVKYFDKLCISPGAGTAREIWLSNQRKQSLRCQKKKKKTKKTKEVHKEAAAAQARLTLATPTKSSVLPGKVEESTPFYSEASVDLLSSNLQNAFVSP